MARLFIFALLFCLSLVETQAQCHVAEYAILANARSRGQSTSDILPSRNGELFVLLRELDRDTLSSGEIVSAGDHLLIKYDREYRKLWSVRLDYSGDVEIRLDSNGFPLISGIQGIIGSDTVYRTASVSIVRLNDVGSVDRVIPIRNAFLSSNRYRDVQFAVSRNFVFVATRLDTSATVPDTSIIIQKLDFEGNVIWRRYGRAPKFRAIHQIAVDAEENVYFSGAFTDTAIFDRDTLRGKPSDFSSQHFNYFIVKLDTAGSVVWSNNRSQVTSSYSGEDQYRQIMTINRENLYVLGHDDRSAFIFGADTVPVGPIFLASLTPEGALEWVRSFNHNRPASNFRFDIAQGEKGSVYISLYGGSVPGGVFQYSDVDSFVVDNNSQILLKYSRHGDVLCGLHLPRSAFSGIGSDASGTAYMAGFFRDYAVFTPGDTVWSSVFPRYTGYIARLGESPSGFARNPVRSASIAVWPIPASRTLSVIVPDGTGRAVRIQIISVGGTVVVDEKFLPGSAGTVVVDIENVPSGVYLLRADSDGLIHQQRIVVAR